MRRCVTADPKPVACDRATPRAASAPTAPGRPLRTSADRVPRGLLGALRQRLHAAPDARPPAGDDRRARVPARDLVRRSRAPAERGPAVPARADPRAPLRAAADRRRAPAAAPPDAAALPRRAHALVRARDGGGDAARRGALAGR